MSSNITNPISSRQVVEVPILKSDCADFCGNDLNSWLKWLMDKQCEYNWKNFDISCLNTTVQQCDKNLETILKSIVESICTLNLTAGESQAGGCGCDTDINTLDLNRGWDNFAAQSPAIAQRVGNVVHLKGKISGYGSTLLPIAFITDSTFKPSYPRRIPFASTFFAVASRAELMIDTDGSINIVWAGLTPSASVPGDIWLDGVSFLIN